MVNKEILESINNFIVALKSEGFKLEKTVLYGSYAKGNAREESDIDLMLVTKNLDRNDNLSGKAWRTAFKIDHRIEPVVVDLDAYEKNDRSVLIDMVREHGIEITHNMLK